MITAFHAKYFAHELRRQCSSEDVQKLAASLADARVDLNPHQVDAALFAFLSPLSNGALLADEVGLGKTIEAGILLSQKWAERRRRLLVIAPANLRKQWHQELSEKFFLPAVILESSSLKEHLSHCESNPFDRESAIVICSYQFARTNEERLREVQWDLAVIDEAHRLRNVHRPNSRIAKSIKAALAGRKKVLLTATPLQNSLLELYGLVTVIDEYTFGDIKSFREQFIDTPTEASLRRLRERIQPLCQRTLRRQVSEYVPFTRRHAILQQFHPTPPEQRLYELVSEYLRRPKLFALPSNQRTLMTLVLRKLLASSTYAISGTLEVLANRLGALIKAHGGTEYEPEQITSDFEAIDEIKDEWQEDSQDEHCKGDAMSPRLNSQLAEMLEELRVLNDLRNLARSIVSNAKGEALIQALKRGLKEARNKGASNKAVVFTESRRTQDYLLAILEGSEYAGKIVTFNGSNNDARAKQIYDAWLSHHQGSDRVTGSRTADTRAALVEHFRDEAVVFLATEAAAEGINLQFCALVVNYDMPWNPQRIEQRIGRCHRYGQKCDVVVVNFLNQGNAVDERVYELLDEKFELFSGVFGASDEILGAVESGVEFEKRIARIYQECRTPEQIEASFTQLQRDLESQIDEKLRQTRDKLLENFDEEVQEKLRIRKGQSTDCLSRFEYWLWELSKFYLKPFASFDSATKTFLLKESPFPDLLIKTGRYRFGVDSTDAYLYRIGYPLAQRTVENCANLGLPPKLLRFQYSNSSRNIAALEALIGKGGWLRLAHYSVKAFEHEDYLVFSAITDSGRVLDQSACQRLFSLDATEHLLTSVSRSTEIDGTLEKELSQQRAAMLGRLTDRNGKYFDREYQKLERWSDDQRQSLRVDLKKLDEEIKSARRAARTTLDLNERLKIEREKRRLESRRDEAWKQYDLSTREIERKKDLLLDELEERQTPTVDETVLFEIRWSLE